MMDLIISKRELQGGDIVVLDLVGVDGSPLPAFQPGAHIDVEIKPGLIRQYSLCSDPAHCGSYRLGVLNDPQSRGGSAAIHTHFREGQTIRVGEPRNLFPLDMDAPRSVLIGGGIGITPMIAMAHALHSAGKAFEMHYCVRAKDKAAFLSELADAPFRSHVRLHFDDGPSAQHFNPSFDLPAANDGAHIYVCGPSGFMAWLNEAALSMGYPASRLHQEYFNMDVSTEGDAFEVVLAKSGQTITVPTDKTIVAALAEIGVKVDVSCEQGICGTCLCTLLEGEPDHRDSYLTDEEKADNDQIMLCCSRSKGPRLVLDL